MSKRYSSVVVRIIKINVSNNYFNQRLLLSAQKSISLCLKKLLFDNKEFIVLY